MLFKISYNFLFIHKKANALRQNEQQKLYIYIYIYIYIYNSQSDQNVFEFALLFFLN